MSLQNEDTTWLVRLLQKLQFLQRQARRAGGLGVVNPVFQRQVGQAGEMAGVARDEGEAVGHRRAADEDIKITDWPAAPSQSCFLVGEYFQRGRNGQHLLGKQLPKLRYLLMLARLPSRNAIGRAE